MESWLQVRRLRPSAKLPTRGSVGAAGYDLYSDEDATIVPGGRYLVSTGIAIRCPDGTYGRIAPRSGLAVKHGLDTGAGVVDADYIGEVKVLLFNHGSTEVKISSGDRIAQLILEQIHTPQTCLVDDLKPTIRGGGGFGSTGQ